MFNNDPKTQTTIVSTGNIHLKQPLDYELADDCARFYADPYGWVMWAFDWGHGDLDGFDGPDTWQRELMDNIGKQVTANAFDGVNPVEGIREAVASGHGIGKSALTAWLILWIMSTRPFAKGIVTANTGDQLRTKTWAEVGKWRTRCITGHWFEYNNGKGSMTLYHSAYPESWRVDAQTCREENSEAFAGLHAANSTPFYIFDEASAVPDKIWEVAEGGQTDGEPMWLVFGNPTRNTGRFYECFNRLRNYWGTRQIDSRTSKMTFKKLFEKWASIWGEDSDFFRVRVKGQFPRAGDGQLIPGDVVAAAMIREPQYLGTDPLICGVDYARGGDDECVIVFRRGRDAKSEKVYKIPGEKSRDSMKVVGIMTMILNDHMPDVVFGDVGSMGGPINDRLRQLGWNVVDIGFGEKADDEKHYANKTTEMLMRCRQWLMSGGAIMDNDTLERELTSRLYDHDKNQRLIAESKKEMKKRLGYSPDWADALILTFAQIVPPRNIERGYLDRSPGHRQQRGTDYDPLEGL